MLRVALNQKCYSFCVYSINNILKLDNIYEEKAKRIQNRTSNRGNLV